MMRQVSDARAAMAVLLTAAALLAGCAGTRPAALRRRARCATRSARSDATRRSTSTGARPSPRRAVRHRPTRR